MIIFVVAVDTHLQLPPRPAHRRTRSMVREGMETQSTQGQGARNTLPDEDDDIPLVGFMRKKKKQKKK
jgi:hypothetical protein